MAKKSLKDNVYGGTTTRTETKKKKKGVNCGTVYIECCENDDGDDDDNK